MRFSFFFILDKRFEPYLINGVHMKQFKRASHFLLVDDSSFEDFIKFFDSRLNVPCRNCYTHYTSYYQAYISKLERSPWTSYYW